MDSKHIVITRFNLKIWHRDKSNGLTLGEQWLEQRFKLFEQFCLPSLESQTDRNFVWFCFFDIDTPKSYKAKIEIYKLRFKQFKPIYLSESEGADGYNTAIIQRVKSEFIESNKPVLITTRIDNDDCFHSNYIKTINDLAAAYIDKDMYCIFEYGYQYFLAQNLLTRIKYPSNHFLSRIERNPETIKTVIEFKHAHLRKKRLSKNITVHRIKDKKNPFWVEVIHNRNVANDLHLSFRLRDIIDFFYTKPELNSRKLTEFGIETTISIWNQLYRFSTFFIFRALHLSLNKLLKKIS